MKKLLAATLAALCLARPSSAEDAGRLTIADAASKALAQYPSLAAANARADVARRELGEAKALWFPTLNASGTATRYEDPMVVTPIHGFGPGDFPEFDDTLVQGTLTADWLLFDGFGRGARVGQRRSLLHAATADASASAQSLLDRTLSGYLQVLSLGGTLAAHDRRLGALQAEQGRVAQMLEVGRAADVELRRVRAAVAAATAERVRLASHLDVAERDLARLVGIDATETRADRLARVELADTSLASRDALLDAALATSPAVVAATRRADAAGRAVTAARSARWPSLRVVGRYLAYGDSDADFTNEWNAGVQAQLPLFTGGAISSRVGQAQSARTAADADARLARARLEDDLDFALASREEARSRVASLTTAVEQYAEVARIEKLRLDTETGTQTDFLDAEADLLSAEAQLVEARHAEIAARVEIARVTGTLDLAWIEKTLEASS